MHTSSIVYIIVDVKVEKLTSGGLEPTDICVLAYYKQQIQLIRNELKKKRLRKVCISLCVSLIVLMTCDYECRLMQ